MARTALAVQEIPYQGGIDAVTFSAANVDGHSIANDGNTLFYMKNADTTNKTATVVSVSDPFGRTEDLTVSLDQDEDGIAGPFIPSIWNQSGGVMHVDFSAVTSVTVAAIRFTPRR